MTKRCAILGTAQSYRECPFDDPGLVIKALNDGYSLPGVTRISEHYDLHPIPKMVFRPKDKTTIKADAKIFRRGDQMLSSKELPRDSFIRPEGHIEWLKEQAKTIPVWLQDTPPDDWPVNAKRFPIEEVKAFLRARPDQEAYISSSPAMILAHAILEGYTEISIYGIHLATEAEYRLQRPGFEWIIGRAEERGVTIILPPSCPLLKHTHVYGYEETPVRPDQPALERLQAAQERYQRIATALITWPRWKSKKPQLEKLTRLEAEMRDAKQQGRHALISAGAL